MAFKQHLCSIEQYFNGILTDTGYPRSDLCATQARQAAVRYLGVKDSPHASGWLRLWKALGSMPDLGLPHLLSNYIVATSRMRLLVHSFT